jgi:hypothetical protein
MSSKEGSGRRERGWKEEERRAEGEGRGWGLLLLRVVVDMLLCFW